jgi:hypothetical protein
MKLIAAAFFAAMTLSAPAMGGVWGSARIGSTTWVTVQQIHVCPQPLVSDQCPVHVIAASIYSTENLADPRGYGLPSLEIRCDGPPLKYFTRVMDIAWFVDDDGNTDVPLKIKLNVDGRDTMALDGDGRVSANMFEAEISKSQLLRRSDASYL